jgi:hypothetical protein
MAAGNEDWRFGLTDGTCASHWPLLGRPTGEGMSTGSSGLLSGQLGGTRDRLRRPRSHLTHTHTNTNTSPPHSGYYMTLCTPCAMVSSKDCPAEWKGPHSRVVNLNRRSLPLPFPRFRTGRGGAQWTGKSCGLYTVLNWFLPCCALTALRTTVRERQNIPGKEVGGPEGLTPCGEG